MSENGNIGDPFSADTIGLYLEGKLSAGQMHALEKAAMEDPFLADAIEGMRLRMQLKDGSFAQDTLDLHQRLYQQVHEGDKKNKIIPLWMSWRGAAAILLLGGSVFLSYRFLFHNKSAWQPIAITEKKGPAPAPVVPADTGTVAVPDFSTGSAEKTLSAPPEKKKTQKLTEEQTTASFKKNDTSANTKDGAKNLNDQPAQEKEDDRQALADNAHPKPEPGSPVPAAKSESAIDRRAAGIAVQPATASGNAVFRGRVIDQRRQPVIGASVGFKDKKAATVTDEQGRFRLKTNNSDSDAVVVIHSIGYQPASHILSSDSADNLVQLMPSSGSLDEVVVAGSTSKKKPDSLDEYVYDVLPGKHAIRVEKAVPANGWKEYNHYLEKNKKISTSDSVLTGNEIVSFVVDSNGGLSQFKIEKSISPAHDAEAIRLLREGPSWKLLRGKRHHSTVTIKF